MFVFVCEFIACQNYYAHNEPHLSQIGRKSRTDRGYRKVPKFSDTTKLCCNLPKIQTKSPNLRVFSQEDANGIANSEDPDQTAPLGAV